MSNQPTPPQLDELAHLSLDALLTCLVGATTLYATSDNKSDRAHKMVNEYIAEVERRFSQTQKDTITRVLELIDECESKPRWDWNDLRTELTKELEQI